MDEKEYWSQSGQLPLIPIVAFIGRGLQVSVATDSTAYDEFQSWYHSSGSLGFSFGPWAVNAGANSSTSSSSITNTSTGTTISFTDNSNTPYLIAVASIKMEDWLKNPSIYQDIAEEDLKELIDAANKYEITVPGLVV